MTETRPADLMRGLSGGGREIRALLGGNRDYRRLLLAGLISQTGDWVIGTGLAFHVYRLTGSTLSAAVMLLLSRLPDVVLGPVAGALADRWDRRRLLVATDVLLALGLLPLAAVREPGQMWIVYAVALWTGVLSTVLAPAQKALVPQIVAGPQLVRANALHGQAGQAARLLGAMLGGAAVSAGGLAAVVAIDVASFAVSAVLQAGLRTPRPPAGTAAAGGRRGPGLDGGVRLPVAGRGTGVRMLVAYMMIVGLGEGVFATLAAPFVSDVLGGEGDAYGLFLSAQAVGGIAGGLLVALHPGRAAPRTLLGGATIALGVVDLALFMYPLAVPALWPAPVLIGLAGVPAAAATAGFTTLAQTVTDDARLGRVFGVLAGAHAATGLAGMALAGLLGGVVGIVPVLCVHAAGLVTAGILALTWRHA
ncbi:MFS transporter [Nonomuraea phyllanthi]|uniref:MFS transporter n=1 Tax=Nonomuraea phyllanthi TaxID=2219224 RepID=UPI0012935205|nr:MFS transporter [Nonomuraea phyllanthi]QFY11293.1 MFS transporter [Nonomuraea phyllanthi]